MSGPFCDDMGNIDENLVAPDTVIPDGLPKLDPVLLARAFEVSLPQHHVLSLSHNDHKAVGQLVGSFYNEAEFLTLLEYQKACSTQEVWTLEMMQADGTGMLVRAATLQGLMQWLVSQGLSYVG